MSDRPSKTASLKSIAADFFTLRFESGFVYEITISLTLIIAVAVNLSHEVKRL